jgi:hypothetical protein
MAIIACMDGATIGRWRYRKRKPKIQKAKAMDPDVSMHY